MGYWSTFPGIQTVRWPLCHVMSAVKKHDSLTERLSHGETLGSFRDLSRGCKEQLLDKTSMHLNLIDQQRAPMSCDAIYNLLLVCTRRKDLAAGRRLHMLMARSGLDSIAFWGDHLIRLFASCGSLLEANQVFCKVSKPSLYTWNAIISAYLKFGHGEMALELYLRMLKNGVKPDRVTFLSMLKTCSSLFGIMQGRIIHEEVIKSGFESNVLIGSALVDMYAKCGILNEAYKLFEGLSDRDVVCWCAMISGYVQHGHGLAALLLFEKMRGESIRPDRVIFLCILKACNFLGAIEQGRLIHEKIVRDGLESDLAIGNTLVDMHAKCGNLEEACKVFNGLANRDAVSWSAIIAGYSQHGYGFPALELFERMHKEGMKPSNATFLSVLKACSNVGALEQGRLIHELIMRVQLYSDMKLGNALVDMYAKCGIPEEAYKVFVQLPERDIISWGAIIAGHVQLGSRRFMAQLLECMQQQGLKPNGVIFTNILAACSHDGLVEEGQFYFKLMKEDYAIAPTMEHYSCMLDLLGRTGRLREAEQFIQLMPLSPDAIAWKSLLTGCRTHGNIELGRRCFDQLVQVDPDDATAYVLMSSMYADAHMWVSVNEIQEMKRCAGAWKKPGKSWIEVDKQVYEFIMGAKNHEESEKIYSKLQRLGKVSKKEGHVLQLDVLLESIPEEDKEDALCCL